ncbi:MAG: hypothetical protein ACNA7Y_03945, partial [Gammaproteobacteria bacterium]
MMTDTKLALLISATILLSGCAILPKSAPNQKAGMKPDTTTHNLELTEAAISISRSLSELAAIEKASKPA